MIQRRLLALWTIALTMITLTGCHRQSTTVALDSIASAPAQKRSVDAREMDLKADESTVTDYLSFFGDSVIANEYDGQWNVFTSRSTKTNSITPVASLSGPLSYVVPAGAGGRVVLELSGSLYLVDPASGAQKLKDTGWSRRVTDVTWSSNARYFCYLIKDEGTYTAKLYDCDAQNFTTIPINAEGISELVKEVEPISICVSENNRAAVRFLYNDMAYFITLRLSDVKQGIAYYSSIILERCDENGSACFVGDVFYYLLDGDLVALNASTAKKNVLAKDIDDFTVSCDGRSIAYTQRQSSSERLYLMDSSGGAKAMLHIFRSVGRMCFNESGNTLLVQHSSSLSYSSNSLKYSYMTLELD